MVLEKTHKLTLHNDEKHSYDYVTACLIKVCKYEIVQALQCTTIVDGVGEYDIVHGPFDEVLEIKLGLEELGLNVELNENTLI